MNTVCILRYVICVVSCYLKNTQVHVLENSACQESELYNHLLFIDHILAAIIWTQNETLTHQFTKTTIKQTTNRTDLNRNPVAISVKSHGNSVMKGFWRVIKSVALTEKG